MKMGKLFYIRNIDEFKARFTTKHYHFLWFCLNISITNGKLASFWFRIFRRGLSFKNIKLKGLNFSESHGYTKILRIGKWLVTILK